MTIPTDINLLIPVLLVVLNEGLKRIFNMPDRFAIVVSWIGGIGLYVAFSYPFAEVTPIMAVVTGFILGSSACGLYDSGKLVLNRFKEV